MSNVSYIKAELEFDKSSDVIRERDRKFVWHPWSPLSLDRSKLTLSHGEGYKVWDIDGKEYIDASSLNLTCGYSNQEIGSAIHKQLLKLHGTDISLASHEPVGMLAERLAKNLPSELSKNLFVNSGSEGIEAAIFIATCYWNQLNEARSRIVSFSKGYHGSTLLSRSISKLPRVGHSLNCPLSITYVDLPNSPKELRQTKSLENLLDCFEKAIKKQDNDPPIAVIVEPFLNVGGGIILPQGFLTELRKLCDETNTLLILDEVFTGYGRSGKMFAFQHEQMMPDILVSSKGLASGYMPITAVTVQEKIYNTFDKDPMLGGLRYGHTTSGHAVSCVAALATLDILERDNLPEKAQIHGKILADQFSKYIDNKNIIDVRGFGLIIAFEMNSADSASKLKGLAENMGLLLRQAGETIMVVPPLTIDLDGIKKISTLLEKILTEGSFI